MSPTIQQLAMIAQTRARPLNVVYVRDHLAPSGGTTYLRNTLPRFDPRRIRASLCVLQPRDDSIPSVESAEIPTFFAGRSKRDPRHLLEVRALLRTWKPDLLVLSGPKSMIVGGLLARVLGLPSSPRFNNMLPVSKATIWVQRRLLSTTTVAVAVSHAVRDWAAACYRLPPSHVEVIHPGHETARFALGPEVGQAIRAKLGIDTSAPVVALVGRLVTAQKGQDLVVKAMPRLLRSHPNAILLIIGEGPDRELLETLSCDLGIGRAVRLLGHRDDVPEILAAADVVAIPSVCEEAFPFTALEGWAAGRPLVAFASGGLAEMVQHRKTGLVIPKGDAAGLIDAILRVLNDAALADRLVNAGRRAAAEFTVENHVEALSDFYRRIVASTWSRCDSRSNTASLAQS